MTQRFLPLLACLLLQACAISDYLPPDNPGTAHSFTADIAYAPSPSGRTINAPSMGLNIWLPGVSGDLYGTANREALLRAEAQDSAYRVAISPELLEKMAGQATPYESKALQIAPADTRLLRIALTVNHPYTGHALGDTYWQDKRSETPLLLLYTDRATHIQGTVTVDGNALTHDIRLPGPGLYWLRQVQRFGQHYLQASQPPTAPRLTIKAVD